MTSFSPFWKHSGKSKKKKRKKDRNASDDIAGGAMGTSIREAVVGPPAVTAYRLALNGGVAGGLLWPILPFTSFPSPAVLLLIGAPGSFATQRR